MERSYKDDLNDTCLSCIACCSAEISTDRSSKKCKCLRNLIKHQGYSQGFYRNGFKIVIIFNSDISEKVLLKRTLV